MQKSIVPQFIDVEPKILGPLTVRQFIFVVSGGMIIFLSVRFADMSLMLFITLLTSAFVFLFGFLKVNGVPFHLFLLNILASYSRPSLRVWHKNLSDAEVRAMLKQPVIIKTPEKILHKKNVNKSRLAELSLIVDTRGEYKGE